MSSPTLYSSPTKVCCPWGGGGGESPAGSHPTGLTGGKHGGSRGARLRWGPAGAAGRRRGSGRGEHCVGDMRVLGPGWDSSVGSKRGRQNR